MVDPVSAFPCDPAAAFLVVMTMAPRTGLASIKGRGFGAFQHRYRFNIAGVQVGDAVGIVVVALGRSEASPILALPPLEVSLIVLLSRMIPSTKQGLVGARKGVEAPQDNLRGSCLT